MIIVWAYVFFCLAIIYLDEPSRNGYYMSVMQTILEKRYIAQIQMNDENTNKLTLFFVINNNAYTMK